MTLSGFEKVIGGFLGGALFGHGGLQPLDFRRHQRDALGQFLDRQQRQVLPDLMGDFLPRLVVVLDGHAFFLRAQRSVKRLQAEAWLANQVPLQSIRISQGKNMEKLPAQMTVIGISRPGGPEVRVPETRAVPAPGPGEILVKVAAAGVNRPDISQRAGHYPPPPGASDLPGLEAAGTVAAIGSGVSGWKQGDAVCALTPGGSYAEY